jgi:D-threo-aldose 1-dehydrogenase
VSIDPAATRALGRTGLRVTQLGFGAAPFGNLLAEMTDAQAYATVDAAVAAGVGYFDTAPFYGHGLSEHRLGATLRAHPRERFQLSTKVGRRLVPDADRRATEGPFASTLPFACVYDYSYDGAMRSLEDSHQRLGMARIDIAFIHDMTPRWQGALLEERYAQSLEGAYRALDGLRRAGVVGAIGVGINDVAILERYCRDGDFDVFMLAGRYTLLDTTALPTLLPRCQERGVSIVLAAPYHSGILATGAVDGAKYWYANAPDEVRGRVDQIAAICRRHGTSLQAAATQFPLAHPVIASVVAGLRDPTEVAAAVTACRAAIPSVLWQELRESGLIDPSAPVPGDDIQPHQTAS